MDMYVVLLDVTKFPFTAVVLFCIPTSNVYETAYFSTALPREYIVKPLSFANLKGKEIVSQYSFNVYFSCELSLYLSDL